MFNVQTLVKTGDRPDRRNVFYSNIWRFISSYPEFFVLTTGKCIQSVNSELKQVTFLTTRTSTGSKVDVFHQSQPLTQSSDVTHAVRVVKNVTCLSQQRNSVKQHHAPAQTVLTCQQHHELIHTSYD